MLKESRGQGVRTLRNAFDVVLKAELSVNFFYVKRKKKFKINQNIFPDAVPAPSIISKCNLTILLLSAF